MTWKEKLLAGVVIPAHPLALTADRKLDERRQRALTRYYRDAGAGGLAVAVHTTQFEIHEPARGLLRPVLEMALEEMRGTNMIRVVGLVGPTAQAVAEAEQAAGLGYEIGLLSLAALREATVDELIDHVRAVTAVMPVMGFYLQPDVGGRVLPPDFWARLARLEGVVGIKVAPFHRYRTLDVLRGVAASGRASEIALYTGNDDNIVADLLTDYRAGGATVRFTGGLLGQWAVWTERAVAMLERVKRARRERPGDYGDLLAIGQDLTDANGAIFDVANRFHGCIAGIHEILRRQGLLEGIWCLNPAEGLSPGQAAELDRITAAYPHLADDAFIRQNLDRWLR